MFSAACSLSLGVIWAFVAVATLVEKQKGIYIVGIASLLAILCGAAAISTLSKAAVVLVILAALLSAMLWVSKLQHNSEERWGGWIALSIVLCSVYVVFFRGCLAESAFGERSLLVRSQYFVLAVWKQQGCTHC